MIYLRDHGTLCYLPFIIFLAIGLLGCSSHPGQYETSKTLKVPAEPNQAVIPAEKFIFYLDFESGTKTRYKVTTETVTVIETARSRDHENSSAEHLPKVSELSEVTFTREILGPLPEDANTVVALITIDQIRYIHQSSGQPDITFDSSEPADGNNPFANLTGKSYTIEITPTGYVTGVFNLRPARLAVRGPTRAHAAALEIVNPTTIFPRHGYFNLPGPDIGSIAVDGRWLGVQQYTLTAPGTNIARLGTYRFDKIYQLQKVEQRPEGAVAVIVFEGSPRPRNGPDGRPLEIPLYSCSYAGGGEFNLDAGRVENYMEYLEIRMPLHRTESPYVEDPEGRIATVTRSCWVQRLDSY